jgi:hypothetical protein
VYSFNGSDYGFRAPDSFLGAFQFFGPTTTLTISNPAGATLTASGSLSLLAGDASYNPGNMILQADVCLHLSGQNAFNNMPYVRPIGGGSYPVATPSNSAWFTIAASSAEENVAPGTYEVGMCAVQYPGWGEFLQVVGKGWVSVSN